MKKDKSIIISMSLPSEYRERLDQAAKREGMYRSEFIRLLIDNMDKIKPVVEDNGV